LAVRRALSAPPGARFANVVDFVAALQAPATPMTAPAVPARAARPSVVLFPPTERAGLPKRRWVLFGALSLAVAGAAVLALPGPVHTTKGPIPTAPRPDSAVSPSDTEWTVAAARPSAVVRIDPPAPAPSAPPVPSSAPPGRLFVNATPWGRIYVDGVFAGNTPKGAILVTPGTHRVRVVRDGFAPFEDTVRVEPGQDLRLTEIVLAEVEP
jgi:hypothetical protein